MQEANRFLAEYSDPYSRGDVFIGYDGYSVFYASVSGSAG